MLENGQAEIAVGIQAMLAGRRFGVLGLNGPQASRISQVLTSVRALFLPMEDRAPESWAGELYDAVILSPAAAADPRIARWSLDCPLPILVISSGDLPAHGTAAAYSWAGELLQEPWSDAELLTRVFQLLMPLGRRATKSARSAPVVLIADDDICLTSLLSSILKGHGICCYTAGDGREAWEMTKALVPSLVVLDIDMPRMTGFEVLHCVRRQPGLETVLVALLTGCDHPSEVVRGSELGADEYIVKPLHPLMFMGRIKRLLRSGRWPGVTPWPVCFPAGTL